MSENYTSHPDHNLDADDPRREFVESHDLVDWDASNDGISELDLSFDTETTSIHHDDIEGQVEIQSHGGTALLILGNSLSDSWEAAAEMTPDAADRLGKQLQLAADLARNGRDADVRM
jgi:hypothetical protein